jgi:hypothetical protein
VVAAESVPAGGELSPADISRFVSSGMQVSSGDTADQVQSAAFATAVRQGLQGINPS